MQIFYVMSCNEWKNTDSMRLVFLGTSKKKVKSFIRKEILSENFSYGDTDRAPMLQAREFSKDWETLLRNEINDKLHYAYFDYGENNREL